MSFKNKKKQKFKNSGAFGKINDLEEANLLIEDEKYFEALAFLENAVQKYPSDARFWEMLGAVASLLNDVPAMQKAFGKLKQLQPGNADAWFGLAFAYGLDGKIALSFRGFRDFLRKFPTDEKSADAAQMLEMAEKDLRRNLAPF